MFRIFRQFKEYSQSYRFEKKERRRDICLRASSLTLREIDQGIHRLVSVRKRKSVRAPRVIRGRKISPEKRNPPRSPVDSPEEEREREGKNPLRRQPQKAARSRGCAILKSVPLVARLTPSTRPTRGTERAPHAGARKRGRKREGI